MKKNVVLFTGNFFLSLISFINFFLAVPGAMNSVHKIHKLGRSLLADRSPDPPCFGQCTVLNVFSVSGCADLLLLHVDFL